MSTIKNLTTFILVLVVMILWAIWEAAPLLAYILLAWVLWKLLSKILKPILRMIGNGFKAAIDGFKEGIEESKGFFRTENTISVAKTEDKEFEKYLDGIFDSTKY